MYKKDIGICPARKDCYQGGKDTSKGVWPCLPFLPTVVMLSAHYLLKCVVYRARI